MGIHYRHATNNPYERFNGEIKDRIARIRGFSSKDPALFRLLIVYHSFMRPHSGPRRQNACGGGWRHNRRV